ncbi:hypothetical protein EZV62_025077 [Acer yangbiense]|uniref:SWIM-type domain-containing protein n=1 Tax=Acer yangbiense TaxID=1000413 RepID=A0A5C7GY11_9ROSI|nr:hypothetical protein EZV62_025077 [Acer yangbiense]
MCRILNPLSVIRAKVKRDEENGVGWVLMMRFGKEMDGYVFEYDRCAGSALVGTGALPANWAKCLGLGFRCAGTFAGSTVALPANWVDADFWAFGALVVSAHYQPSGQMLISRLPVCRWSSILVRCVAFNSRNRFNFLSGHQPSLTESDTNVEPNITALLDLNDPCVLRGLKSSDMLGREFSSLNEAEVFYEKYAKVIGFNVRKDDKRTDKHGSVTLRRWVCAKEGYRPQKLGQKRDRIRQPRALTREGCCAAFKVNHHNKKKKWIVKEFATDHTHVLASTFDIQYFRSRQNVQALDSTQDLQNGADASSHANITDSDWETALAYLSAKKEMDPGFYFNYTWLLETFLSVMQHKKPNAVITDCGKGVRKAIKKVMPECVHRLCCWDLERNAHAKVKDANFKQAFRHCMMTNMTLDEFDQQWSDMVNNFSVQENPWVLKMYAKRHRWAEALLRGTFFGWMNSTQMSESMYTYLNRFAEYRLKLYEFVRQIDRALARVRSNEAKDDFESRSSSPVPGTHLEWLEKHAADIYTVNIFTVVLEEIREEARLIISGCVEDMDKRVYTFTKFRSPHLKWTAVYSPATKDIECSCLLFQTVGIPCSHLFSVMKAEHLCEIPECLIMQRWRKNAKVVKSHDFSEAVPTEVTELVRFGSLMAQCSKLCYYASKSIAGYNEAKQAVCSLTRRMEELMTMDLQSHNTTLVPSKRGAVVNDPHIARTKGAQKSRKQCNATMTQGDRCMEIGHTNQTYEKTIPTSISAVSTNTPDVNCDSREYVPDRLPTIDKQCSVLVDFNVQVGGSVSCDSTVIAPTPQSFPFGVNSRVSNQVVNLSSGLSPISPFNAPFADAGCASIAVFLLRLFVVNFPFLLLPKWVMRLQEHNLPLGKFACGLTLQEHNFLLWLMLLLDNKDPVSCIMLSEDKIFRACSDLRK